MKLSNTKILNTLIVTTIICCSQVANASCDDFPERPSIFEKSYILESELDASKLAVNTFVNQTNEYMNCLDAKVTTLNIDFDKPDENSEKLKELVRLQALSDLSQRNQQLVVDRYNVLLENVEAFALEE